MTFHFKYVNRVFSFSKTISNDRVSDRATNSWLKNHREKSATFLHNIPIYQKKKAVWYTRKTTRERAEGEKSTLLEARETRMYGWEIRAEMEARLKGSTALVGATCSGSHPQGPVGHKLQFLGSGSPEGQRGEAYTRVRWSSIPANVRPARPQFIRHLPSPSARLETAPNLSDAKPALRIRSRTGRRNGRALARATTPGIVKRVIMLMNGVRA